MVLICIFENKVAQLFDMKRYRVLQELSFSEKYKVAQTRKVRDVNGSSLETLAADNSDSDLK